MDSLDSIPSRYLWYLAAALTAGLLLYRLAPIVGSFLFAAVLACICVAPVDRLRGRRVPRTLTVIVVLFLPLFSIVALVLVVLGLIEGQSAAVLQDVPDYLDRAKNRLLPRVSNSFGLDIQLEFVHGKELVQKSMGGEQGVVQRAPHQITTGGLALVGFFTVLRLVTLRHSRVRPLRVDLYKS